MSSEIPNDTVQTEKSKSSVYVHSQEKRDSITKAEIIYCLHVVDTHSSLRSADNYNAMFRTMFPDSQIANDFKLAKDKVGYVIAFGLGEYYREKASDILQKADMYVLQFC